MYSRSCSLLLRSSGSYSIEYYVPHWILLSNWHSFFVLLLWLLLSRWLALTWSSSFLLVVHHIFFKLLGGYVRIFITYFFISNKNFYYITASFFIFTKHRHSSCLIVCFRVSLPLFFQSLIDLFLFELDKNSFG